MNEFILLYFLENDFDLVCTLYPIQYIIAAMLGKYVSRGGSRVLDLDIHEGRNLYYYPSDVKEVVAITDQKNFEVVKNQGI